MKHVLIIDESGSFREYLKLKLEENDVEASIGINSVDGMTKMKNLSPDLIIMDDNLSRQGPMEVLKQKKTSPNTANIPVILMSKRLDQKKLLEMIPYNVKKVFTKPVRIDTLFATLSEMLEINFLIDESPGIVEVHVNENIIFVEIAKGLNRDKLDLLRFKITELIRLYEIRLPKVIVMLSDMELSFTDGPNLEKLMETILVSSKAKHTQIRVLTRDEFTRQFIQGRPEYSDIEAVSNLQYAIDGLLADYSNVSGSIQKHAEIIGDKILAADPRTAEGAEGTEAIGFRFHAESSMAAMEMMKQSLKNLRIAVIDDEIIIHEQIRNTFRDTGAEVQTFFSGNDFLKTKNLENYDLIFLDLVMSGGDGFKVLAELQTRDIKYPIIILSAVTQREMIIKAYQMGVKSFLVKPIKPQEIFKKSIEILRANF